MKKNQLQANSHEITRWLSLGGIFLSALITMQNLAASTTAATKLLLEPGISNDKIAFVYAGDIWLANQNGTMPRRLTSHVAEETNPHFSPDGQWIAFTANYDNNCDVYLLSVNGGQPKRLTWHPEDDIVNGWSKDGKKVLFTSRREMRQGRSAQAWEISTQGGLPTKVMEAVVQAASWSADGKQLAYQPYNTAHRGSSGWRNHRGGSTPPIWILAPGGDSYEEIPHVRASDTNPLWVGKDVYFLSDRDGVRNLYQYTTASKQLKQVTFEKLWDISSADAHGSQIIYSVGGELKILDTKNQQTSNVSVHINPDLDELKVQWKDAMSALESVQISPSGKRALLSARGEVFSVPLKDGSTRNLTNTDGVRERDALWSPNGDKIAFTSDSSGEQQLVISDQNGKQINKGFVLGTPADYTLLSWSGDASKIVYADNHLGLWSIDIKSGKRVQIDTDKRRGNLEYSVSADGQWLAYTKSRANYFADIYLYNFKSSKSHRITDGMSNTGSPAFSPDGQYLYFTASTNAGVTAVGLDMSTQERAYHYGIYAAVLSKEGKSPLLPKSDEEVANQKSDKKKDKDDDSVKKVTTKIDLDGIGQRIVALPIAQKAYQGLQVAHDGSLFFIEFEQPGNSIEPDGNASEKSQLMRFEFEEKKTVSMLDDVTSFNISSDGKTLITVSADQKIMTAVIDKKLDAKELDISQVKARINPRAEWSQIFEEVWRTERDYFYADNMHGLDWKAVGDRYRSLLPHVGRRADLNYLMVEMIAELQVGHNRVSGGDLSEPESVAVGLLGADLRVEDGQYKINKIYSGENWNPDLKAPLSAPGIGAKVGDTIHSVNGIAIDASINIYALLENTVDKQISLQVSSNGQLKNARQVIVEPIANDNSLRFWSWIEDNRRAVDKATDGKVAYVYLPDTAGGGFTFFNRMFFAQTDKKALIVDERRNSGGQAANYITDILSRQYLASWKDRDGMLFDTPGGAIYGPKVMLIDQDAGSGGDFLPYSFKRMGLGKLIGKTTWGGLIGIAANRRTIDGGMALVPFFRFFTPDNEWRVENEGVAPDMDVVLDPVKVNKGIDTQLQAGIKEVMQQLQNYQPIRLETAPPLPTKLGQ